MVISLNHLHHSKALLSSFREKLKDQSRFCPQTRGIVFMLTGRLKDSLTVEVIGSSFEDAFYSLCCTAPKNNQACVLKKKTE